MKLFKQNIFLLALIFFNVNTNSITISIISCNNKANPVNVSQTPKFSWILQSDERNQTQTAYQIIVSDNPDLLDKNYGNIWDSKNVYSNQSILIDYKGKTLNPGSEYFWKVKVWDKNRQESDWSKPATFVTAMFDSTDWHGAKWIGYENIDDSLIIVPGIHPWGKKVKDIAKRRPVVPLFRKEFIIKKEVESAYLFISGLGHYKASINGLQISDDFLSPGWTDYRYSCLYNTYDVKEFILKGKNAIGAMVGNGFYNVNNERYRKLLVNYGIPKVIGCLKIKYSDGTCDFIITDSDWKTAPSTITYSSIYGGEDYDARLEQKGWNQAGFNDSSWQPVLLVKSPSGQLKPETTYPIKALETFSPIKISAPAKDTFIYDFGQNASGIIKVKMKGQKGQIIRFRPGELLNKKGFINQNATGRPYYFEYTLKGDSIETWQPSFTYYGFRYVQVEGGIPESSNTSKTLPEILDLKLLHTYNSAPKNGKFECSNELFNKIDNLILYAIQSNLQSVLTDCPHREKLGWLEQTYLMGGSMHYNFDLYHLYSKLIDNMIEGQTVDGLIPEITPEYVLFDGGFRDSPEWGSAGIILPWLIYKWYGDSSAMKNAWPLMVKYIGYLKSKSNNNILSQGLGDWYDLGPKKPGVAQLTPKELTATAIYYYDAQLMTTIAGIIGKVQEKETYSKLAEEIKTAFNNKFFNPKNKIYSTGSQTAMAMSLCIGLVNENDREKVLSNLLDSINKNGKALTAGDIGFHFLVEALSEGSADQLLYDMNNRDDVPGYGFQLKKGATALTESWAGLEEVSNNHLMLGHIMEWFYKGLGGIQQADTSVAYKTIVIKPAIINGIDHFSCSFNSSYGMIKSNWKKQTKSINLEIEIPVNTTAIVVLKDLGSDSITENNISIKQISEIKYCVLKNGQMEIKTGSGKYSFKFNVK